jgi:glycosyltransferase involved in cell wall biosynthesis
MKKILHVAEAFGGGIVTFIANLANEQCQNFEVIVAHGIRPETHANYREFFDPRIQLHKVSSFNQNIKFRDVFSAIRELYILIQKINPDVIHMHSSQSGVLGKLSAINSGARLVYSPHGFSFLKEDVPVWKRQIFKGIEKLFSWFDCTLVASSATEFENAKEVTSKVAFIPNGINTNSLDKYLDEKAEKSVVTVGMVGRALPQKNPALFNRIAELLPEIQFVWIGDGEQRNLLTSKNIYIVGWGSREEALTYLAKVDVYIMTSLWEGMPLSLLEAMYFRKACVVSNVVGNRDVIQNNWNGYIANTAEEFASKIKYLLENRQECERMGLNGQRDITEKYNSGTMARKFEDIYLT